MLKAFLLQMCGSKESVWKSQSAHPPAKKVHAMGWRPFARTLQDSNHFKTPVRTFQRSESCIVHTVPCARAPTVFVNERQAL